MSENTASKKAPVITLILVIILLLGGFIYWSSQREQTPQTSVAESTPAIPKPTVDTPPKPQASEPSKAEPSESEHNEPRPDAPAEPKDAAPAPQPAPAKPALPALSHSDDYVAHKLQSLTSAEQLKLIVTKELIRKMVRAVIGVADGRLVNQYRPVRSPLPPLGVTQTADGDDPSYQLNAANYQRYAPYIALMESIEPQALASAYKDLQPLFTDAYKEQGLDGTFTPKLLSAINMLLATPEVTNPPTLKRPAVMYKFADPTLENLPAPQKLMLRIGPDNRRRVSAYLSAFKAALKAQ